MRRLVVALVSTRTPGLTDFADDLAHAKFLTTEGPAHR